MMSGQPQPSEDGTMNFRYPYTRSYRDRHGKLRIEYRRDGKTKPLRGTPGTAEFQAAYDAAASEIAEKQSAVTSPTAPAAEGTWRWLCIHYFRSLEFQQLDPDTQRARRRILESTCLEPWTQGSSKAFGSAPLMAMTSQALMVLRDRKAAKPEAARGRLKAMSRVFDWAMEAHVQGVTRNPARDVKYPKARAGGFHSWSPEEVARFEATHQVGTKARLAFALLMFTGQRKSDIVVFGPQHVSDGVLRFTQQKNAARNPVTLALPVLPALQAIIDATPTGPSTFLVTEHGKPFSRAGFGARMRKWCDQAGLPECTSHGLRKAGAVILAEAGATDLQLMSVFGWRDIRQAQRYTKAARQKLLAADAMPLILARKVTK
jgi:integrase